MKTYIVGCIVLVVLGIMAYSLVLIGETSCRRAVDRELIERGIKQYNQQTGEIEWVDGNDE